MTQLGGSTVLTAADGAGSFEIDDSTGLAIEYGRLTQMEGTVVADSFQTRLTAQN